MPVANGPCEPEWMAMHEGTLVPFGRVQPLVGPRAWYVCSLFALNGKHSGLAALHVPDHGWRHVPLDDVGRNILWARLMVVLLPPSIVRRLAELLHEFELAMVSADSEAMH